MGEFGRTPKLNAQTSRDHWPQCYTVLLAGGGVKRGYVHGRSDRQGAFPDRDGVPIEDLAATTFALLGIDPQTEGYDRLNRPLVIPSARTATGRIVSCVPGSPVDCGAMTPMASPRFTWCPRARSRP